MVGRADDEARAHAHYQGKLRLARDRGVVVHQERVGEAGAGDGGLGACPAACFALVRWRERTHSAMSTSWPTQRAPHQRPRLGVPQRRPVCGGRGGRNAPDTDRCACRVDDRGAVQIDEPAKGGRRTATNVPEDRVAVQLRCQGLDERRGEEEVVRGHRRKRSLSGPSAQQEFRASESDEHTSTGGVDTAHPHERCGRACVLLLHVGKGCRCGASCGRRRRWCVATEAREELLLTLWVRVARGRRRVARGPFASCSISAGGAATRGTL